MEHKTQSGDKEEYKATDVERLVSTLEIFFNTFIRPAIKEDVRTEFEGCMDPLAQKMKGIETRLLIKTVAFAVLIIITFFLTISMTIR